MAYLLRFTEIILISFSCQDSTNNRSDQYERCDSDKYKLKTMQNGTGNSSLRITEIPIQIRTSCQANENKDNCNNCT